MNYGYDVYIDDVLLPITPGEMSVKIGSTNETVTLINEGEINILKSPSLVEIEFDARFPMRNYPYSREPSDFKTYFDKFKALKENKTPFQFIVYRNTPGGKATWDTDVQMTIEEMEINESADEGDDVIISFSLKQYKNYGVRIIDVDAQIKKAARTVKTQPTPKQTTTGTSTGTPKNTPTSQTNSEKFEQHMTDLDNVFSVANNLTNTKSDLDTFRAKQEMEAYINPQVGVDKYMSNLDNYEAQQKYYADLYGWKD